MRTVLLAFCLSISIAAVAQTSDIKSLIAEGVILHDKGDYQGAILRYDEALKLDKADFMANYEKAMSCMAAKRYDDCIAISKFLVKQFEGNTALRQVYTNWASAVDDQGDVKAAHKIYDEGIRRFPTYYGLYFNKGLTQLRQKEYQEALGNFTESIKHNPLHPSSLYYSAGLLQKSNRVPALLLFATFIAVEPQSDRSKIAAEAINEIVYRNIKTDGNNVTISLSPDMLNTKKSSGKENDFKQAELIFSMVGAMDNNKTVDSIAQTAAAKFDFKLQLLIGSLSETAKGNNGLYWKQYVPFFADMKAKGHTEVLSNLISMNKDAVAQVWVAAHQEKVDDFYTWLKAYSW